MIESMETFSYNIDIVCFLHKKEDLDMGRDIVLAKIKKVESQRLSAEQC